MPTKILIAGIGGVGGYFGGLLARHYSGSEETEVYFLARGRHLDTIRNEGLTVIERGNSFVVMPKGASDKCSDFGVVDFILICIKSYDLPSLLDELESCISAQTVLIPLLNGVDSFHAIQQCFPFAATWHGFAYIVSRQRGPGVVDNFGNIEQIYFGLEQVVNADMHRFETLLRNAGIKATCSSEITKLLWEKFIFISPIATITSYFNYNFGQLRADESSLQLLKELISEIIAVAAMMHIPMDADIADKTMNRVQFLVSETSSSMQADFQNHPGRTELETLCGYVVRCGVSSGISTPVYQRMYTALLSESRLAAINFQK